MGILRIGGKPLVLRAKSASTFSGNVTVDGSPAARTIKVYRNNSIDPVLITASDSLTGNFSFEGVGNHNDFYTIEKVGLGEGADNSEIFTDVKVP